MTRTARPAEVTRFRAVLAERLGWVFADDDSPQLARVLGIRADHLHVAVDHYLNRLATDRSSAELAALAEELTITETYFFRYGEQFQALADIALPELIGTRADQRRLRFLSVGCSSGEEAYTLAIAALTAQPDPTWDITVLGLDANPAMLRRANAGRYSAWSLRETPDAVRQRWFRPAHESFEVDPRLRAVVRFRRVNVLENDIVWRSDGYDVMFCRNLLMYLTPAAGRSLVRRMTSALAPGGFLFLGHTDTLGMKPEGLQPQQAHHTFYYRRPDGDLPTQPRRPATPDSGTAPTGTAPADTAPADTAPADTAPADTPPPAPVPASRATPDPGGTDRGRADPGGADSGGVDPGVRRRALQMLRSERFADALAVVEDHLPAQPRPADLLLHGVLLAQSGRLDAAEIVARQALDTDGLYADAHHLLGSCLEDGATVDVAIGHYRLAAYLDPAFAMPRLRLGLLARRRGDHHAAGTELESALHLLGQEAQERVDLFGGGFARSSLLRLCRTELSACGRR